MRKFKHASLLFFMFKFKSGTDINWFPRTSKNWKKEYLFKLKLNTRKKSWLFLAQISKNYKNFKQCPEENLNINSFKKINPFQVEIQGIYQKF